MSDFLLDGPPVKVGHVSRYPNPRPAREEVPCRHAFALCVHHVGFPSSRIERRVHVARLYAVDALGHALSRGKLSLNAPGSDLMSCSFSWRWPTIDPMSDHSEDIANVRMIFGRIAQSLECDLVSDASLAGVKETDKVQMQVAIMCILVEVVSSKDSIDASIVAWVVRDECVCSRL